MKYRSLNLPTLSTTCLSSCKSVSQSVSRCLTPSQPVRLYQGDSSSKRHTSSGAVWKSRWPSWAPRPNEPYGFCGPKATLNHAHAVVSLSLICQPDIIIIPAPQSSGVVWKSRWPSWAPRPNEPYGFCGPKATVNHAHALVTVCP